MGLSSEGGAISLKEDLVIDKFFIIRIARFVNKFIYNGVFLMIIIFINTPFRHMRIKGDYL